MRFAVGAALLLVAATATSHAQPGMSVPASTPPREWTYEIGLAPTFSIMSTDIDDSALYPGIGLRLGAGRWITPRAVLSVQLAWNMNVIDMRTISFRPKLDEYTAFAGMRLARWFADRAWIAGTAGASVIHVESDGEYRQSYADTAFGFGGNAGFAMMTRGAGALTLALEATQTLDRWGTTTVALVVGYQRL